jgi:hypothetical protein
MRLAGRFSRRLRADAQAHGIPVVDGPVGERQHELAEEDRAPTQVTQGLFLISGPGPGARSRFWIPSGATFPSRSAALLRSPPR